MMDLRSLRISLKFSEKDPDHVAVAKLLKQLGRKKSSFIVKAVKYYMENNPMPDIPGTNAVITSMVTEAVVRATILKMLQSGEIPNTSTTLESLKFEIPDSTEKEKVVKKQEPVKQAEKIKQTIDEPSEDDYIDGSETKKTEENAAVDSMLDMLDDF